MISVDILKIPENFVGVRADVVGNIEHCIHENDALEFAQIAGADFGGRGNPAFDERFPFCAVKQRRGRREKFSVFYKYEVCV